MAAQTHDKQSHDRQLTCPRCRAVIQAGSRYCVACGAALNGGAAKSLPDPRNESLLASANLSRLRGDWQAAEARCIEVLKSDPNNVNAHSLLGDLYRGQSRLDEAAQWYRLAVDLDPGNRADRMKLETVLTEIARRQARSGPLGSGVGPGTQKLMGIAPVNWVRGLTAISVVFAVLVLGIVIAMRGGQKQPDVRGTLPGSHTGGGNIPQVGSPLPIPGKPATETAPGTSAQAPNSNAQSPTPIPGATRAETSIQNAISQANLGTDVLVGPVTLDPRQGIASLILTINGQTTPDGIRDRLSVIAISAARAAFAQNMQVQVAAINLRASSNHGVQPVFTGDIDRRTAEQADPSAPALDLIRLFNEVWFAPQFAPADNQRPPGG